MKQKKYGKKVINWHRPFRSFHLSQRYLRLRYKDPEEVLTDHEDDEPFDPYGDDDLYWNPYDSVSDLDYAMHKAWNLISKEGQWGEFQLLLSEAGLLPAEKKEKPSGDAQTTLNEHQPIPDFLEEKLARHMQQLSKAKSFEEWLPHNIRNTLLGRREDLKCLLNLANDDTQRKQKEDLVFIALFSPFWIRRPSTWVSQEIKYNDRFLSLVEHLFVKYPVPACLHKEWLGWPDFTRMKWVYWFILFAQGGSLYKAASYFNWDISKKIQHHFLSAPSDLNPTTACIYAEVIRLGGGVREFERLCTHRAFVIDPTTPSSQKAYISFWKDTIQWLTRHGDDMTDEEAGLILDWAMHQYTETERDGRQVFSWKGRSLQRVLAASAAYRQETLRPYASYKWKGHGWNWERKDGDSDSDTWSFVELTSGEELFYEGKAMHHCVASYATRCVTGYSAIVSLRYGELRKVTIEINPDTKKIAQARGRYNRLPPINEQRIIDEWVNNIVNKKSE